MAAAVGEQGSEKLLQESFAAAQRQAALSPTELRRVNVDTTVQEKAIAFPTDARLYHKARCALVRVAQLYPRFASELRAGGQARLAEAGALCGGATV